MARRAGGGPTSAELDILKVLWELGPSATGAVREALVRTRPVGYTTVQKMLQTMTKKRLVTCDRGQWPHLYRHRESRSLVVGRMVKELLSRALDGSRARLLLHALESEPVSPEELAEMRQLLDTMENPEPEP